MAQTFNNGEQLGSIRTVLNDNANEINTLQASKAPLASPTFTGQASFADGSAAAPSIAHTGDLNAGLFFPAADTVAVATAGTERMRVDSSGKVGIGTSSPAKTLTVSTADQSSARVRIVNTSGRTYDIVSGVDGLLQSGFSIFDATAAETRLTIDSTGNVGIGTSSPLAKVHSQVNTFTTADMVAYKAYNNQAVGVYANFQNSATGTAITDGFLIGIGDAEDAVLHNQEATNMIFSTSATERMRIDSSGNVGIGTTSPNAAAILDAQSTTKGVRFPNMTTTQKNAIANVAGLVVFDTTLGKLCVNTGSAWQTITSV